MQTNSLSRIQQFFTSQLTHHAPVLILLVLLAITWVVASGVDKLSSFAPKRVLTVKETTWPKGVLELVEVKNLTASNFPKKFGLVVKNITNKPIYFISINVQLPGTEQYSSSGFSAVMQLYYGSIQLAPADSRPGPNDIPLMPGESCTLSIADARASRAFHWLDPENRRQLLEFGLKNIVVNAQKISFGDGTGYLAGKYYPIYHPTYPARMTEEDCGKRGADCFASDSQPTSCCLECDPCEQVITVRFSGGMPCQSQSGSYSQTCPECYTVTFGDCGPIVE